MLEYIFMSLGGIFTLTIMYGVAKMDRKIILKGLLLYSILPLLGETLGYMLDKQIFHILFIALFLCQLSLATIVFQTIEDDHPMFSKFAVRVIACFILINAVSALIILGLTTNINPVYGIFHVLISISLIPPFIKRLIKSLNNS
tara:strand:- start:90 stop:521 length:432 start_codon:yes stop_codon:yes gene_type:complete